LSGVDHPQGQGRRVLSRRRCWQSVCVFLGVIAGLAPAIHAFLPAAQKAWTRSIAELRPP
ncbi:MAG: hypothetical protein ACLP1D_01815, partial [Xanthobacteraceae bacterium]